MTWIVPREMPKGLKRFYGQRHLHFVTCSCYRRLPLLGRVRARNEFVRMLGALRTAYQFKIAGYVVMPEHIHLLVSEPVRGTVSTVMQVLKQRVSRKLRAQESKRVAADAFVVGWGRIDRVTRVLAAAILRLQCVHREKDEREAACTTIR